MHPVFKKTCAPILNTTTDYNTESNFPTQNVTIKQINISPISSSKSSVLNNFQTNLKKDLDEIDEDDVVIERKKNKKNEGKKNEGKKNEEKKNEEKNKKPAKSMSELLHPRRRRKSKKHDLDSESDSDSDQNSDSNLNLESKIESNLKNNKKLKTEEDFWIYIDKLQWVDKSDGYVSIYQKHSLLQSELGSEISEFKEKLDHYVNYLKLKYITQGHYFVKSSVDTEQNKKINAFLSHVVARGQIFYSAVYDDPLFADYLIELSEYQDLYQCL